MKMGVLLSGPLDQGHSSEHLTAFISPDLGHPAFPGALCEFGYSLQLESHGRLGVGL